MSKYKYIIILLLSVFFIGSFGVLNSGNKLKDEGQPQEKQDRAIAEDNKDEKKKSKKDTIQVRKRPDRLWVSRVYEDVYFMKLMNARIKSVDRLELRPDSTFRLTYSQAQAQAWGEGMWSHGVADTIILNCTYNEPREKKGNLFVEKGIRKIVIKGDRARVPRDVSKSRTGKEKMMILKKTK